MYVLSQSIFSKFKSYTQWPSKFLFKILQEGVAIEIAEAVVGALKGELSATAVNAPMVPPEVKSCSVKSPALIP